MAWSMGKKIGILCATKKAIEHWEIRNKKWKNKKKVMNGDLLPTGVPHFLGPVK